MKQSTQRRLVLTGQLLLVTGLILSVGWNAAGLWQSNLQSWWWVGLLLALPGLLLWLGALAVPYWQASSTPVYPETYRLVYDAPEGWSDIAARQALLTMMNSGGGLDITWAREGAGVGCWLALAGGGEVLERLVQDVFPEGRVEEVDHIPAIGQGVVALHWQSPPPGPAELCRLEGVEGVYYRRRGPTTATVAIWGPGAGEVIRQWAAPEALLTGQGETLRRPPFAGDNPWPELPAFPPSQDNPGLAAVSRLERPAPTLRAIGPALRLGNDAEGQPLGFELPELAGLKAAAVVGQVAEQVVVSLVIQAVQAGLPVMLLDGRGTAVVKLSRLLLREIAAGRVLLCDVERPAQSRFRLNPLWLPGEEQAWPAILSGPWLDWLRELGVTPGGLGQAAYRHTLVATVLMALTAARRDLALDVRSLRDTLAAPDFLPLLDESMFPPGLTDAETRAWWLAEGRRVSNFDAHLRLGHLRERLSALLELPEYGVLWRGPYLDPLAALNNGVCGLFWRVPDPRRRLRSYLASQLLALATLLTTWPVERPVLIILHEVEVGAWPRQLAAFPGGRVIVAGERAVLLSTLPEATTRIVSRLKEAEDTEVLQTWLPDVPTSDLRRLPLTRLIIQHGSTWGTVEMVE